MVLLKKAICFLLILLITLVPLMSYASDAPSSSAFSSPLDDFFNSKNANDHIKYRDNYYLDTIDGKMFSTSDAIANAINACANVLFQIQVTFAYLLITVFYYSFELDIFGLFSGVVKVFMNEMKTSVFDELSLIAILFLGIFFIVKVVQNQRTQVWVAILQTALIIAISLYFFSNPMQILEQVDKGSKEISKSVLAGTFKANNNGAAPESAVMAAVDNIWTAYVHQPWRMLEFGNMDLAKKEENNILKYSPSSEERKEYIKKLAEDEKHFTPNWGYQRIGLQLVYTIPLVIIFSVIFILSGLMLAYQVLTILFMLMGAFVLVMALIPFFGTRIIQNWALKIVGFASVKIVICFCIGIILAFMTAIFKVSDKYGWMLTLFLIVVIVVAIIWKRDKLIELFTFIRLAPQNPSMINKQIRKDSNIESRINDFMGSRISGIRNKKERDSDSIRDSDSSNTKTKSKSTLGSALEARAKKQPGNSIEMLSESNGRLFNETEHQQENDNSSLRQLMKKAEEILQKQYEISKADAEIKAEKLNKEPEYSSFVRKVDTRESLGAPKFEQREIISVAQNLQKIKDSGGRPDDVLQKNKDKVAEENSRPKDVISLVINGQQQKLDKNEAYKIILEDASKEYTQEFNQEYDKKYDPKFFEGLIKRYGQQNVRQILNKMKDIKEKDGSIKNPAGYLTQSLKNNTAENGIAMRGKGAEKIE